MIDDILKPLRTYSTQKAIVDFSLDLLKNHVAWPYQEYEDAPHPGRKIKHGYKYDRGAARSNILLHNALRTLVDALESKDLIFNLVVGCNPGAMTYTQELARRMNMPRGELTPEDDTLPVGPPALPLRSLRKKNALLIKEYATDDGMKRVRDAAETLTRLGLNVPYCIAIFGCDDYASTTYVRQHWTYGRGTRDATGKRNAWGTSDDIRKAHTLPKGEITTYMLVCDRAFDRAMNIWKKQHD
jgi:hypothetical protein